MFTLGGSSVINLENNVINISLHDTYYVVSHFHIVLSLGTILAIFIGVSAYQESIFLHIWSITNAISLYHVKVILIGILVTFIPMHYLSFNTHPRRISDFPDSINWWNSLSSLGCSLTWVSFFVLITQSANSIITSLSVYRLQLIWKVHSSGVILLGLATSCYLTDNRQELKL